MKLTLRIYGLLWRLALPFALLRLWWRGRAEPLYRQYWAERLGWFNGKSASATTTGPRVWVHAVSLGETRAAAPLIEALRERMPQMRLLLTHMTATGRAAGAELLQPGDLQVWLPYDLPGPMRRFLRRFQPCAAVLMETEVWPNLAEQCRAAGVPVLLANARLSARSASRWQRWPSLARVAWGGLFAAAQTPEDARRIQALGAAQATSLGNLKFDMRADPALMQLGEQWKAAAARPVLLLASTREQGGQSEEALLLAALPLALAQRALLVWVPRHPQRFDAVAQLLAGQGHAVQRRSMGAPTAETAVWLGDSLGEMAAYYAMADAAFIGGSLLPLGGQNLIEACACGCPVVLGPSQFNFAAAAQAAIDGGAAVQAMDAAQVWAAFARWLDDPPLRQQASQSARAFAAAHQGAAQRQADWIVENAGKALSQRPQADQ
ncbi:MAG: 3-deoxy-D-manno-octulosonic acid transferase [Thiomonas arsenitoxydans]|uniref:3-deoxy-D-manno-octulosonic acid transferase n=1 Tax=Thiomonas arsenitoxydans (strain DSM 22701 / CIP 110005 / 3As) TaxID=426114 RepID=A0A8I1MV22_THIA3|nr:3-deoxy-D-manno-octulosonic acid transferase [Thiomonas arsenitoxydans]MBN8743131.1 3-deoxy-D-manno-octulosonic acid transferase [Thiomonas arsenitoxydans]